MWIIGYGSLIFRPPPVYDFKISGFLQGYIRRFWQSSCDHRGTEESPGRVVTLVSIHDLKATESLKDCVTHKSLLGEVMPIDELLEEDMLVWGVVYYIGPSHVAEMKAYLDEREQQGYTSDDVKFFLANGDHEDKLKDLKLPRDEKNGCRFIESTIYIGKIDNESFVGPEDMKKTAEIIAQSKGDSGPNREYLLKLNHAVHQLNGNTTHDLYLEQLERLMLEEDRIKRD